MNMNKMAKFLKKLREDRGLTQEQLGEIINVSRSLISKWENGNKMPAVECLQALSKFYDITIDEIIFGERKTKANALEIDSLSATIITDSRRKFNIACKAFSVVILILLFIIFGAYFILNYNAYKLYSVGAKGENFDVKNTLMFITKNESYIQFGNITDSDGDDTTYDGYKFYALDGDKKIMLSSREDGDIVRNVDDTDNYLNFSNLEKYIDDLYVDIYYDDKIETLKLNVNLEMSNNKIFNFNNRNASSINKTKIKNNKKNLPTFISENFTYDEDKNVYKYETNINNEKVMVEYDQNIKNLVILRENLKIIYEDESKNLTIYDINQEPAARILVYDVKSGSCIYGDCQKHYNFIDDFNSNYKHMIEN